MFMSAIVMTFKDNPIEFERKHKKAIIEGLPEIIKAIKRSKSRRSQKSHEKPPLLFNKYVSWEIGTGPYPRKIPCGEKTPQGISSEVGCFLASRFTIKLKISQIGKR